MVQKHKNTMTAPSRRYGPHTELVRKQSSSLGPHGNHGAGQTVRPVQSQGGWNWETNIQEQKEFTTDWTKAERKSGPYYYKGDQHTEDKSIESTKDH